MGPLDSLNALRGEPGVGKASKTRLDFFRQPTGPSRSISIEADGRFEIAGLPPGSWVPSLHVTRREGSGRTYSKSFPPIPAPVGKTTSQNLDLGALKLGSLRGRLAIHGVPRRLTVGLRGLDEDARATYAEFRTSAQGEFLATELLPGRYRMTLALDRNDRDERFTSGKTVDVRAGQSTRLDLNLLLDRLRVRVLDAKGVALSRCALRIRRATDGHTEMGKTDAQGRFETTLERGRYRLSALRRGTTNPVVLGIVEVRTRTDPIYEIRLPR